MCKCGNLLIYDRTVRMVDLFVRRKYACAAAALQCDSDYAPFWAIDIIWGVAQYGVFGSCLLAFESWDDGLGEHSSLPLPCWE